MIDAAALQMIAEGDFEPQIELPRAATPIVGARGSCCRRAVSPRRLIRT
jgi:hypothetical protein